MDKDLILTSCKGIKAGFTKKPGTTDERRQELLESVEKTYGYMIKPILVHGKDIAVVTEEMLANSYIEIPNTDGVVTDIPNVLLTTTHADCLPLYAYDPINKVIGLAHAGWKGTSIGIAQELINSMTKNYNCKPENIYTYIGPGIGKCHFEFGADYAEECFVQNFAWMKNYISEPQEDKVHIDLKGINKHFFELEGVKNIEISKSCTYCDESYYSYRRSADTERMIAYIMLEESSIQV